MSFPFQSKDTCFNSEIYDSFEDKRAIEKHIQSVANLRYTILRPAYFCENFISDDTAATAFFRQLPSHKTQLIACKDIGVFAAMAFVDSGPWEGRTISLAGDELTTEQIQVDWEQIMGKPYNLVDDHVANGFLKADPPIAATFKVCPEIDKCHRAWSTDAGFTDDSSLRRKATALISQPSERYIPGSRPGVCSWRTRKWNRELEFLGPFGALARYD